MNLIIFYINWFVINYWNLAQQASHTYLTLTLLSRHFQGTKYNQILRTNNVIQVAPTISILEATRNDNVGYDDEKINNL